MNTQGLRKGPGSGLPVGNCLWPVLNVRSRYDSNALTGTFTPEDRRARSKMHTWGTSAWGASGQSTEAGRKGWPRPRPGKGTGA